MAYDYKRKALANELSGIFNSTRDKYERIKLDDRMAQAADGQTTINVSGFAYGSNADRARSTVLSGREKATGAIDRELQNAKSLLTQAPSTEATNYIMSISGRSDLSQDEVEAALSRYTDHASQKAIIAAASRSFKVKHVGKTEAETYIDDLNSLRESVNRTYNAHQFGSMSAGAAHSVAATYDSFGNGEGTDVLSVFRHI